MIFSELYSLILEITNPQPIALETILFSIPSAITLVSQWRNQYRSYPQNRSKVSPRWFDRFRLKTAGTSRNCCLSTVTSKTQPSSVSFLAIETCTTSQSKSGPASKKCSKTSAISLVYSSRSSHHHGYPEFPLGTQITARQLAFQCLSTDSISPKPYCRHRRSGPLI